MVSPYKTNFEKGKGGNILPHGTDLIITINDPKGDPIYVAGMLYKRKSFGRKTAKQSEQTSHKRNPSKNSIKFEMIERNGSLMERGDYRVETRWNFGGSDIGIEENFEIE